MLIGIALILIGVFSIMPKAVGITLIVFGGVMCLCRLVSIIANILDKLSED